MFTRILCGAHASHAQQATTLHVIVVLVQFVIIVS